MSNKNKRIISFEHKLDLSSVVVEKRPEKIYAYWNQLQENLEKYSSQHNYKIKIAADLNLPVKSGEICVYKGLALGFKVTLHPDKQDLSSLILKVGWYSWILAGARFVAVAVLI